jgi:hypothetical protein
LEIVVNNPLLSYLVTSTLVIKALANEDLVPRKLAVFIAVKLGVLGVVSEPAPNLKKTLPAALLSVKLKHLVMSKPCL